MKISKWIGFAYCFFLSTLAAATPIEYQLTFNVSSISGFIDPNITMIAPPSIGSQYFATMVVDDSVLNTDGYIQPDGLLQFSAQIGSTIWDPSLPQSTLNEFSGYRGLCYGPITCTNDQAAAWGLGAPAPGFYVENGTLTALFGGVYGTGDIPFIDFNPGAKGGWAPGSPNTFSAMAKFEDAPRAGFPFTTYTLLGVAGGMSIERIPVPVPPTIALFSAGLLGIAASRRRSARRPQPVDY